MKFAKIFSFIMSALWLSVGSAWGPVGHKTTALIAEAYLSPQARAAVLDLLDGERLVDVVTWADSLRGQAEFAHTLPYHYQNMPNVEGVVRKIPKIYKNSILELDQAKSYSPGVVEAILAAEQTLLNPVATKNNKKMALKFLAHFIGDLHQPLHTGRAENRGGNSILLQWRGHDTNLHRLWDSDVIYERLKEIEVPPGQDITVAYGNFLMKKFQAAAVPMERLEDVGTWYRESLVLQNLAYDERYISDQDFYASKAKPTVDARVFLAGRRMADALNKIFEKHKIDKPNVQLIQTLEKLFGALENLIALRPE